MCFSYSVFLGPTDDEKKLMLDWIRELAAFIHNDESHDFGTRSCDEFKTATPEGKIEVTKDTRWRELLQLANVFSGAS